MIAIQDQEAVIAMKVAISQNIATQVAMAAKQASSFHVHKAATPQHSSTHSFMAVIWVINASLAGLVSDISKPLKVTA
jgi:hypothetical protein